MWQKYSIICEIQNYYGEPSAVSRWLLLCNMLKIFQNDCKPNKNVTTIIIAADRVYTHTNQRKNKPINTRRIAYG
jgi:hypothetical protein